MVVIEQASFLPWCWHIAPSTELRCSEQRRKGNGSCIDCEPCHQHISSLEPCLVFSMHLCAAAAVLGSDGSSVKQKCTEGQIQGDNASVWLIRSHLCTWLFLPSGNLQSHDQTEEKQYEWVGKASPAPASGVCQPCLQGQAALVRLSLWEPDLCLSACGCGPLAGPVNMAPFPQSAVEAQLSQCLMAALAQACLPT